MGQKRWPIPNDWDSEKDGYISVFFCIPNSRGWRSLITGLISGLGFGWNWDGKTGNIKNTQEVAREIFESMQMGCLEELITVQQETNRLLRLQIEAITGGSVNFADDVVVPDQADYATNGLVPTINDLAKQFKTDNWVSSNRSITDILAGALYGKYIDPLPNPIEGDGIANILNDQIQTLHKRFRMDDASIFNLFNGEKNITETLETLLRTDKASDLEQLAPNVTTVLNRSLNMGDGLLASIGNKILGWLGVEVESKPSYSAAELLFLIAASEQAGQGGAQAGQNSLSDLIAAIKGIDATTSVEINNGCGCEGDCEHQQIITEDN